MGTGRSANETFINPVLWIWFKKFRQSLTDIRWSKLRYMLIFSLAPLFGNMQHRLFPEDPRLLGLDAMSWLGIGYCIGAGILFAAVRPDSIPRLAKAFSAAAAVSFLLWVVNSAAAALLFAFLFCFFVGGMAGIQAFLFSYALNDSERFFGAAVTSVFCLVFQLVYSVQAMTGLLRFAYHAAILLVSAACLVAVKPDAYRAAERTENAGGKNPTLPLMLFFFFAHKTIEVFYTYINGAYSLGALRSNALFSIGLVLICSVLYYYVKFNVWHMCNLFFLGMSAAFVFRFIEFGGALSVSRFFHAFEQIGFVASYVLLGGVMQRCADFRTFKKVIIGTLNAALLIYAVPGVIAALSPDMQLLVSALVTFAISLAFLVLAPLYARHLFGLSAAGRAVALPSVERASDTALSRTANRLQSAGLTKREQEVIDLLLHGYMYKQCASELNISIETVKFHIRNAYRKLNISGRNELFTLFMADARD